MAAEAEYNLIKCPDFVQGDDISPWYRDRGSATITAETGVDPVYGDVVSYGKITDRTSNYECFSQDVTGLVEKDKDYLYSFYVMLDPVDYGRLPPNSAAWRYLLILRRMAIPFTARGVAER